jgi:hypothetical protein
MLLEHRAKQLHPAPPVRCGENLVDLAHVEDARLLGVVQRTLDLALRPVLGDVEQRARERRARNAIDLRDGVLGERHPVVDADAAAPIARGAGRRHVDPRAPRQAKLKQHR